MIYRVIQYSCIILVGLVVLTFLVSPRTITTLSPVKQVVWVLFSVVGGVMFYTLEELQKPQ